ncbi:hypothetical protein GGR54DRAFT_652714 [Hypoxylon sp. NC1633]|nr:hypothetical protein GGR54DRAFT_652714 [Hypoxylon sp. NC1633]
MSSITNHLIRNNSGVSLMIEMMAELRTKDVEVDPVIQDMILQLDRAAKHSAEETDILHRKHVQLQAKYAQLATEFNFYCKDTRSTAGEESCEESIEKSAEASIETRVEAIAKKIVKALLRDIYRTVDTLVDSNEGYREEMKVMIDEYAHLGKEKADLRVQMESSEERLKAMEARFAALKEKFGLTGGDNAEKTGRS